MTETERLLMEEVHRLKEDRRKQDEERWQKVQEHMSLIPSMSKKLEALDISINGCDEEPEKGIKVRLDRLEQTEKRRDWWITSALGASISAIGVSLWNLLRKGA